MKFLKKWFSLPDEPALAMRQSVLGSVKSYLFVRWKKRWPIVVVTPFFVVSWAIAADPFKVHQQLHRAVILAVIFVVAGILFPFRWGGEDWEEPKT
jgi:hypothetical protein